MSPAERYRALAAHLNTRAARETNPARQAQWTNLAQCYARLADQAEHNSRIDIVFGIDRSGRRPDSGGEPA
ncbi:MAG TPA: hypothetical protein VFB29_11925 [Pseudolabrys sp.]|nr:hypothetical protein [Pseudolabrys sp.]